MIYQVADIVKDVRVCLDQNMVSDALAGIGDVDTLALDEIIESKIEDAARLIESRAASYLLDSGQPLGGIVNWNKHHGYGSGHIQLPNDFLRLVCFQMSDWDYAVTQPITEEDPLYARQHSRFGGVRGNPRRPVVAITRHSTGLVLEFYTSTSGNATVKHARYITIPKVNEGTIDVCEKLKPAIVYYAAYMTELSLGNRDLATSMLQTAMSLADIETDNYNTEPR